MAALRLIRKFIFVIAKFPPQIIITIDTNTYYTVTHRINTSGFHYIASWLSHYVNSEAILYV